MSTLLNIRSPSVLATLPRPIDPLTGRYVVSDVHGGIPGSRKRKRQELAVGIDGEGVNLYDIHHSRLVTSYALPPQSSFTCPPCSIRVKHSKTSVVERTTYVSIKGPLSEILSFRETKSLDGIITSESFAKKLPGSGEVCYMCSIHDGIVDHRDSLLVVRENGEIQCLAGDDLEPQWTSVSEVLSTQAMMPLNLDFKIDFVSTTNRAIAAKQLLSSTRDTISSLLHTSANESEESTVLVLITRSADVSLQSQRVLHIVALPRHSNTSQTGRNLPVTTLKTVQIPWNHKENHKNFLSIEYDLQASSGILFELVEGHLTSFEVSGTVAQVRSKISIGATSFLPISLSSIVAASNDSLSVLHSIFRSTQATFDFNSNSDGQVKSKKRRTNKANESPRRSFRLVAYAAKVSTALGISGNELLSFQIDTRRDDFGKPQSLDLLLDSIGRGGPKSNKDKPKTLAPLRMNDISRYLPGSMSIEENSELFSELDKLIDTHQNEEFDRRMGQIVGLGKLELLMANGDATNYGANDTTFTSWIWPQNRSEFPQVDQVWVQYIISRVLNWAAESDITGNQSSTDSTDKRLRVVFFPLNTIRWLVSTGNLNRATITTALQSQERIPRSFQIPAGQIVKCFAEIDPEMNVLLSLLTETTLDATELVHSIRLLLNSLGMLGEIIEKPRLLTSGIEEESLDAGVNLDTTAEEEDVEFDLELAEYRLGEGSNVRHLALSVTLAKLYTCASVDVVQALQSTLTLREIMSLIYVLRHELRQGSWTLRYLIQYQSEYFEDHGTTDGAIILISTLLNRCVDAVGAGGWLSGDGLLHSGSQAESEELITSLKIDVSAALEGVQEATYLGGLTREIVKFADKLGKATAADSRKWNAAPIVIKPDGQDSLLPVGLKVDQMISLRKIGAGGEIYERSRREIGHLKSKKVGKYQRERINV